MMSFDDGTMSQMLQRVAMLRNAEHTSSPGDPVQKDL